MWLSYKGAGQVRKKQMRAVRNFRIIWFVAAAAMSILMSDFAAAESVLNRGAALAPRSIDPHFGFGGASTFIGRDLLEGLLEMPIVNGNALEK